VCLYVENPTIDEDLLTVWRAPAAVTITEIFCKATGGSSVLFDFANDGATVNGAEIDCSTVGTTEASPGGDATVADGGLLDVNIGTVSGAVAAVSLCFEYSFDSGL
jgi:hypothetical protein